MQGYSKLQEHHILTKLIFDTVSLQLNSDLYSNNMMQYLPLLKYYSSTCQELLGSIYKTLKNCQASHKCDPLRYEVLVQMDETKELVSELIETFLHCLVFDKYDSDISVTGYYCCVLRVRWFQIK